MPNSKARNRPGVKLGGTLILFTVLFGLVDRHVFIYKSVRTFFHPNRACGEAERFVSRGDSAGAFPLSPVQKTKVLGTETQVPESSRLVSSSGELFAWWADVLNASSRFRKLLRVFHPLLYFGATRERERTDSQRHPSPDRGFRRSAAR